MAKEPRKSLTDRPPLWFGTLSLITAGLVIISPLLVVLVGVYLWIVVLVPIVLISGVSGVLAIGSGLYYKKWSGAILGFISLVIIGSTVWIMTDNIMNF